MGAYSNRRRNHGRRNFGRRNRDVNRGKDTGLNCIICSKPLRELHSAIACKETNEPMHFDCAIKELQNAEELEPADKICYLGSGSFGIINFRNSSSPIRFLIKKRIQFEEYEELPEWRKTTQVKVRTSRNRQK